MATTLATRQEELSPFERFFDFKDPFSELTSTRQTMNSLFDWVMRPARRETFNMPEMDLSYKNGTYIIEVALPGLEKKDIDIEIEGNCLTVSGKYAREEKEEDKRYHYRELRRGSFCRSVTFPEAIDPQKVTAVFDRGLLKVEIPSPRPALTQKVAIK